MRSDLYAVTYIQQCWYCCSTSEVLNRGHPSLCVSTPSLVHSQDGDPQWWSVTVSRWWVSSYWCLSSAKSSRMTVLLLGLFSVLLFFCSTQLLLMQKTTAKLIVLGIFYIQPLLASSRSANPCLCTLSSTLHIWPSSARLLRHTSLTRRWSTRWWPFPSSLPTTKPCPVLRLLVQSLGISAFCSGLLLTASPQLGLKFHYWYWSTLLIYFHK